MGNRIRHFVGVESSEQLAFIDELHKLGLSSTIELPELVVVGDQSTGKSSVLQAITEISFPVKQDTCTRFPVQISFRQTAEVTVLAVKATITPGRLTAKDDTFRARTQDFCMESEALTQEVLRDMIDKATECIFEEDMAKSDLDLPGLIRNGDGAIAEAVRSLEIAQSIPGLQSRSIGVLSKCDKREERSGEWMVSLLQNNRIPNVPHLDHGWFGIRNRRPIESHLTDAERDEAEAENSPDLPSGMRQRIERRVQLQKGMPQIIAEIRQKLKECEDELAKMGEARTSPGAQRSFVWQFCARMQDMADAALRGRYQTIPSVDPRVRLRYLIQQRLEEFNEAVGPTSESSLQYYNYETELTQPRRGTSLPGSVHPDVEETVFWTMSEHWERYARDAVADAKLRVKDCYNILLQLAIPNKRVRLEVSKLISRQLENWNKDTDNALRELIEDNQTRPLFTLNHTFRLNIGKADELRNRIFNESVKEGLDSEGTFRKRGYLSSLLNNVLQTRAKLEICYTIALYRFIDNVATQVVERHVLGPKCPLRAVSSDTFTRLDGDELNRVAGEDKVDISTRQELERARDGCRKALVRWEQLSRQAGKRD
ncbi:hypothetical protein BDW72DRAFT_203013 [Aspergillus terricola var. indicus]